MLVYLLRRLGQSVFVIAAMAVLVFVGVYAIGNPIDILINPEADQNERAAAIARLGLDKPLWEQFLVFVSNAVQGDLGRSFVYSTDALGLILSKLPATLELAFLALVRSEEHTSELQSLMRISYAVFCLKKKTKKNKYQHNKSELI